MKDLTRYRNIGIFAHVDAGKTTTMLQSSHNYAERGMTTLLLKPLIDDREGLNVIRSRVGLEAEAKNFEKKDNLLKTIEAQHKTKSLNCVSRSCPLRGRLWACILGERHL